MCHLWVPSERLHQNNENKPVQNLLSQSHIASARFSSSNVRASWDTVRERNSRCGESRSKTFFTSSLPPLTQLWVDMTQKQAMGSPTESHESSTIKNKLSQNIRTPTPFHCPSWLQQVKHEIVELCWADPNDEHWIPIQYRHICIVSHFLQPKNHQKPRLNMWFIRCIYNIIYDKTWSWSFLK